MQFNVNLWLTNEHGSWLINHPVAQLIKWLPMSNVKRHNLLMRHHLHRLGSLNQPHTYGLDVLGIHDKNIVEYNHEERQIVLACKSTVMKGENEIFP